MSILVGARFGILLRQMADDSSRWQKIGVWPAENAADSQVQSFLQRLQQSTLAIIDKGYLLEPIPDGNAQFAQDYAIAIRLETESQGEVCLAAFDLVDASESQAQEALRQLQLIADIPRVYQLLRTTNQAQLAVSHFSSVFDLMVLLNAQKRFLAVAMTVCNELASRHKCDRVSLGWLEKEYIRVQAISHIESFEKKMEAVQALELAMEEALDQDEEIVWPISDGETLVTRDHAVFAKNLGIQFICSIPLRVDGKPIAVLTCERNTEPFSEVEMRLLSLCCDMAVRRLSELKRHDQWFGARWINSARELFGKIIGVQYTWAKVIAIIVCAALITLFFGKLNYRVEAPFILRSDEVSYLSAPFDGYIEEVHVKVGDRVDKGARLLTLDTRELLLQEAAAVADYNRYVREAEKARASNSLAEMRIAEAQAKQAQASLDLVRYRLVQAELITPFDSFLVEGDLKKRIGAPVKQGDTLFKIARTDQMYVECDLSEEDIQEIQDHGTGEIAFASQPKLKFPVQIDLIEPMALSKEEGNVFVVRCTFQDPIESWWRPGMSGIAKLNVGKRPIIWIITHKTVDFLRMFFWW